MVHLRDTWRAGPGDVFVAAHFPFFGIQRLLVALVEGLDDPWAPGLIHKPHMAEAAASKRGADQYLKEMAAWSRRRLFKTSAFPHRFPCQYPMEPHNGDGAAPKVVVLIADPRHAFTMWWHAFSARACNYGAPALGDFTDFIRAIAEMHPLLIQYFAHGLAWSQEAAEHPENVRIFSADRLGSLNPSDVRDTLEEIAEFLEIPKEKATQLAAAVFQRPDSADEALGMDQCPMEEAAKGGGHLIEPWGKNLYTFEEAFATLAAEMQSKFRALMVSWMESPHGPLEELAQKVLRGVASAPPLALTVSWKGKTVHNAGACRACVFFSRGLCKDGPYCRYCHELFHVRKKRPGKATRERRDARRLRTPSPDFFGDDLDLVQRY